MNGAKISWNSFSSWLYPSRCALCDLLGELPICASCRQDFAQVDIVRHEHDSHTGVDFIAHIFRYETRVSQAVKRLKYSRATALAQPLATEISEGVERLGMNDFDIIAPVPIHWSRRCERGFNQSELLCRCLPWRPVLRRTRATRAQAGLRREERLQNLSGAFQASHLVAGKSVLLIDDVVTSGQTARECGKALKAAGAIRVAMLALAGELD